MVFTIEEVIEMAVKIEKNGEAVYRKAIRDVSEPALKHMLKCLAEDEARHARWFDDLKHKVASGEGPIPIGEDTQSMLDQMLDGRSFSLEDVDFTKIENIEQLLAISVEFENDTLLFYEMLRPFIQQADIRSQLDSIIAEEKDHVRHLKGVLADPMSVCSIDLK